jgi:type IV pilus assembly protein PilB
MKENIVEIVDNIIKKAVRTEASDIHFEPTAGKLKIRFRIDGFLKDETEFHKSFQPFIISRLKVMVKMDISESRLPQDGKIHFSLDGKEIDLRASSLPTIHGEKIVLRILNQTRELLSLEELGMNEKEFKTYNSLIGHSSGMILITGPTGSGKTTTLYATLKKIASPHLNTITIEDPVEYQLANVCQVQVKYKTGLTFAAGLRSILRQDPDIIMVGEIRDLETARTAVQAALTGHLVFSTLHTNDTASAIVRMQDMGIEPYLLSSAIKGIVAQRLFRKLDTDRKGYKGRSGIYEVMRLSRKVQSLVNEKAPSEVIKDLARKEGMPTLLENGILKVEEGLTTKEEIGRVVELE